MRAPCWSIHTGTLTYVYLRAPHVPDRRVLVEKGFLRYSPPTSDPNSDPSEALVEHFEGVMGLVLPVQEAHKESIRAPRER